MAATTLRVAPLRTDAQPASAAGTSAPGAFSLSMTSDDERLSRARAGDAGAFAEIVRRHQASVCSLAWRMLGMRDQAEELAQDVFVQLHRSLGTIESADHLRFWLRRVVCHRAIDRVRQRARELVSPLHEMPEPVSRDDSRDPILRRRLNAALATLSPAARSVMLLRYQEDLDPTEIARVLDMPLNTVKSHLKRSLAALRRVLGWQAL
jgi:RNA polymerase sigma-70 factor (ECF subfamily)